MISWPSLRGFLEDLTDAIADQVDRWLMDQHMPREDGRCRNHWRRTEWPCRDFDAAAGRRQDRRRRHASRIPTANEGR